MYDKRKNKSTIAETKNILNLIMGIFSEKEKIASILYTVFP